MRIPTKAKRTTFPMRPSRGRWCYRGIIRCARSRKSTARTEIAGPQSFKVVTEGASAMNPANRAAQEEFLRKTARLYRAVNGALHTAEDVESRLKTIREALREVPAVEKQLGAVADSIERRDREILRALRGDV